MPGKVRDAAAAVAVVAAAGATKEFEKASLPGRLFLCKTRTRFPLRIVQHISSDSEKALEYPVGSQIVPLFLMSLFAFSPLFLIVGALN